MIDRELYYFFAWNGAIYGFDPDNTSEIKIWGKDGKAVNPPKGYKVRKDSPHNSPGQHHIHVYPEKKKYGKRFAINEDGTQHDRKGPVDIHRKIYDWLEKNAEGFPLPPNRTLEMIDQIPPDFKLVASIDLEAKIIWFY